jgi:hypothetical protein
MNLMLLLFAAAAAPDWMAGCWSGQQGPMTFEEQWTKPVGGNMLGLARMLKGGKVVFTEFLRIDARNDTLVYTPRIGTKQGPVEFTLKSQSDTQVVFENPKHDFPQRIIYVRNVDGLHARIEGIEKGKHRAQDFPMKSVACK